MFYIPVTARVQWLPEPTVTEIATDVRSSIYLSRDRQAILATESDPTNDPLANDQPLRLESRLQLRLESKRAAKVMLLLKDYDGDELGMPAAR